MTYNQMAAGPREIVVPIDSTEGATERERGQITYTYNTPEDPRGVFSFSYYFRPEPSPGNRNQAYTIAKRTIYLKGLRAYLSLTEQEAFAGWKVVIYTDRATLDSLISLPGGQTTQAMVNAIFTHPNTIVAKCEWPEFSQVQTAVSIDGIILRFMRHKALMDFPVGPVFVRDADTVFDKDIDDPGFNAKLLAWESTLLRKFRETGKRFLVAGSPSYSKDWHKNTRRNFKSQGIFAGLVSSLGGIPQFASGELWQDSLSYIRGYCHIDVARGALSNMRAPTYVGKDEQVILFIWIPALLEDTYFFFFDYHVGGFESGYFLREWANPLNQYNSVYMRLLEEFPQWVNEETGQLKDGIASSPNYKLYMLLFGGPVGTPPAGAREPTLAEKTRDNFEHGLIDGKYIEEERGLIDIFLEGGRHSTSLFNPIVVSLAFDTPALNRMMYLMFKVNKRLYKIQCDLHRGGRRKTRRLRRKISKRKRAMTKRR